MQSGFQDQLHKPLGQLSRKAVQTGCLAHQKEFESPTFRLGGGRSIQLSYWCICCPTIVTKNLDSVNKLQWNIFAFAHILSGSLMQGGISMEETPKPADLDDWLFEEADPGPSQR